MGVTYTTAAERAIRRTRAVGLDVMELALAGASIVALALVVSVWNPGARETRVGAAPAGATIDLNRIPDAGPLDAALVPVFQSPADRRLAARAIFAVVAGSDGVRRPLPNVGAIARVRVPVAEVEHEAAPASPLRVRLDEERRRAAAAGRPAPTNVALFSA